MLAILGKVYANKFQGDLGIDFYSISPTFTAKCMFKHRDKVLILFWHYFSGTPWDVRRVDGSGACGCRVPYVGSGLAQAGAGTCGARETNNMTLFILTI